MQVLYTPNSKEIKRGVTKMKNTKTTIKLDTLEVKQLLAVLRAAAKQDGDLGEVAKMILPTIENQV